jgi:hypothetical protein
MLGRVIAQAVSCQIPTVPRSGHVGFMVDKVALGQVCSEYSGSFATPSTDCFTLIII